MRAELGLPSVKGDDEHGGGMTGGFGGSMGGAGAMGKAKRPINVKFEIPYFTTSGIQVRYLKITEPKVCSPLKYAGLMEPLWLTSCLHSCNIPLSPGSATLHNQATLRSACRTSNEARRLDFCMSDLYSPFLSPILTFSTPFLIIKAIFVLR